MSVKAPWVDVDSYQVSSRLVELQSFLILISTNLYGSLWFGTNERVLLRRRYPTIVFLCVLITTTNGEGYYVKVFYTYLSPWSRSQKRKGNQRGQMMKY